MIPLTREQAIAEFRLLVRQYGLRWTASVPASAYERLNRVNTILTTENDRREALGLPVRSTLKLDAVARTSHGLTY